MHTHYQLLSRDAQPYSGQQGKGNAPLRLKQLNAWYAYYVPLHAEPHLAIIAAIYLLAQTTIFLAMSILFASRIEQERLGMIFVFDSRRLYAACFFVIAVLTVNRISTLLRVMRDFDRYEKYVETQRAKLEQRIH